MNKELAGKRFRLGSPSLRLLEEEAQETASEWSTPSLETRDMQSFTKKKRFSTSCKQSPQIIHCSHLLHATAHKLATSGLERPLRSINEPHCGIASSKTTATSSQATTHLLDEIPPMAPFDSPAPAAGLSWHTHRTWEDACTPLHAFDVPLYQCGLMSVHAAVSR